MCVTLYSQGVHVCGILRLMRGAPKRLQEAAKERMEVGTVMTMHKGNTMVMLWKDKRVVQLITTFHDANTIPVQRRTRVREPGGRTRLVLNDIQKPRLVEDYNQYMSGVDRFDQMIKYYHITRKTHKWTKKISLYFLQMALYNSYILFKKYSHPRSKADLLDYTLAIINSLISFQPQDWLHSGWPLHHAPDLPQGSPQADSPQAGPSHTRTDSLQPGPSHVRDAMHTPPPLATASATLPATLAPTTPTTPAAAALRRCRWQGEEPAGPRPAKRTKRVPDSDNRLNVSREHTTIKVKSNARKRCSVCSAKGQRRDTQFKCRVCDMFLCLGDCFAAHQSKRQYWL